MLRRMRRYVGIGAAWAAATVVSVVIASTAVAGIRNRVVETPVAIGPPTTTTVPATTEPVTATIRPEGTTTVTTPTTTSVPVTTGTSAPVTSTTVPDQSTTTTTTTTTTTAPPTTTASPVSYKTYDLLGGTVVLWWGEDTVGVQSVVPRTGYSYKPDKTGPEEVDVAFVGDEHKSVLTARFEDGEPRVDKKEEGEGDDGGDGEHDG
jgi:hypothetical protein